MSADQIYNYITGQRENFQRAYNDPFGAVQAFNEKYDITWRHQPVKHPSVLSVEEQTFRWGLVREEFEELRVAMSGGESTREVAKEIADLLYVTYGLAGCLGIPMREIFSLVHASNMTKTLDNKRMDGKLLKGPDYKPPPVEEALRLRGWTA